MNIDDPYNIIDYVPYILYLEEFKENTYIAILCD